jgi:hypothetical protein
MFTIGFNVFACGQARDAYSSVTERVVPTEGMTSWSGLVTFRRLILSHPSLPDLMVDS